MRLRDTPRSSVRRPGHSERFARENQRGVGTVRQTLPRLVIVYGGSAGGHSPVRFGEVIDVGGRPTADAASAIRALAPDGIACFIDEHLRWTAEFAELLGLLFYDRPTADRLTDKLAQRTGL